MAVRATWDLGGGKVEALAVESRWAVARSGPWRAGGRSSSPSSSDLLLGELLAGASSCLFPWDGARGG
jgi:hypothetical protein